MIDGHVEPPFWPVARALERQVRLAGGGAAACVYHRGRPVVDVWCGTRNRARNPWRPDTLVMSFSTTKGVTATLLHVLVDRGLLDYDEPVASHWPEFGREGKERITVRQILSHQAGLPHLRKMIDHGERMLDWDHMVSALERARPIFEPGSRSAYHGLTFGWLVGELVQRVTGRRFSEVVRSELAEPLGLQGCFIGAPPEVQEKAATLAPPGFGGAPELLSPAVGVVGTVTRALRLPLDPLLIRDALVPPRGADVFWHPRVLDTPIPAANGLFTARSLARLYAVLAAGGELDGVRLLSGETLRRATESHCRGLDGVLAFRPGWRLGYHGVLTTEGRLPAGFGHFGFGGSGAWADPSRELAVAMVNNRAGGSALGDLRILQLGSAARRCADRAVAEAA